MKKEGVKSLVVWAFVFLCPLLLAQVTVPPEVEQHGFADLVIVNGKIVSMDDRGLNNNVGNVYQAMAVKEGRIIAAGTDARIRTLANSKTKVFDLQGMTVIPGIIETHAHLFGGGQIGTQLGLKAPDRGINITVQAAKDVESTRMRIENGIKDALTKVNPGDWVVVGVTPNAAEGASSQRVLAWIVAEDLEPRRRLDTIATENPVLVRHSTRGNVNSKALDLIEQYLPAYRQFIGQSLGKEYSDAPEKGLVGSQEMGAIQWNVWYRTQPVSLIAEMFRRDLEMASSHGVTTFSSRVPDPTVMDGFMWLARENQMPIRFGALYEIHRRPNDPQVTRQIYRMTGNLTGMGNDWLWLHGVASERWDTDFPQTCLGKDVEAPPAIKKREVCPSKGDLWWDTLQNALESGWRLAGIHGEGSDGVRRFIQMVELAMSNTGMTTEDIRKMRLTVEHAPAIGKLPDVIEGLKKYGIFVSIATSYMSALPAFVEDYGPKVEPFLTPVRSLLESGVKTVGQNHSYRNIGNYWSRFVTRKIGDKVYGADEAIERVPLLKMWTTWAGDYIMKEQDLGTLEVGKLADFVVLDKDFFTIPVAEWDNIRPQMTVIGGDVRFLDTGYAQKLGMQPVGYQFPPNYKPWGPDSTGMGMM
ncbi:MAG: amidohydrolase family protein [Acidobacteria bacterium]|nr:amidohydrolase family protein [Acidobacteriota bacterium]